MEERISCIYCIENTVNGKKYIGQTKDYISRKRCHIASLKRNDHENSYLQHSWNKYGEAAFVLYIVCECDVDKLDELEMLYISKYNTMNRQHGYNRESGGNLKKYASDETKQLISQNHADVSGINNPMYGKKHSAKAIEKFMSSENYINRKHRGVDSHLCLITENVAHEIKKHFSDNHKPYRGEVTDIANKFGVTTGIVSHIKNGHCWQWLAV